MPKIRLPRMGSFLNKRGAKANGDDESTAKVRRREDHHHPGQASTHSIA